MWLRFDDGREVSVDFTETFEKSGVFVPLRDPKRFARVRLENDGRALVWPGGIDFCADALYVPPAPRRKPIVSRTPFRGHIFVAEAFEPAKS